MYSHVKQFLGDEGDIGYKFVVGMTLGSISSLIGWEAPRLFEMHVAKLQPAERLMLVTVLTCIWQVVMLIVGTGHAKS